MSRSKSICANLALLFAGSVVAVLLAEAALRLFDPIPQRLRGDQLSLPRDIQYTIENTHNPKLAPRIVHTKNSLGFRGPELPWEGRSIITFAVGGSTTECYYLGDDLDWPTRLGGKLSSVFPGFWINNAGLDGHSTYGHRLLLEQRLLRLEADVILFLVGTNDIGRDDLEAYDATDMQAAPRKRAASRFTMVARHSALLSLALNIWRSQEARSRGLGHEVLDLTTTPTLPFREEAVRRLLAGHESRFLPDYRRRLEALIRDTEQAGALPVLMTQPALFGPVVDDVTGVDLGEFAIRDHFWNTGRRWNGAMAWRMYERYNDVVRAVGRERGVPVIDLATLLPKSSRLYYDSLHFTARGARVVADIVARELCPILADRFPDRRERECPAPAEQAEEAR